MLLFLDDPVERFASERNGPELPGHSTSECFVFCQIWIFFSPGNIQNKLPNPVIPGFHPIYDLELPLEEVLGGP